MQRDDAEGEAIGVWCVTCSWLSVENNRDRHVLLRVGVHYKRLVRALRRLLPGPAMPHHGGFSGGGAVMRCTALPGPRDAKGLQHSKEASGYFLSRSTVSSCMAKKGCSVCRTLAVRDSHGTCVAREHTTPPLGTR